MGNTSLTRPVEYPEWEDAFQNQVSNRTNILDLAGHYPYSPERWRVSVGGSRKFPEYNSVSQYNHAGDYHELKPASGETVVFESAERPRYVVQYELAATWAFAVNQSLTSGDSIKVGAYDGSNGWYMEHDGSHSDTQADFVLERGGTEVYRRENKDIHKSVKTNARLKLKTGWYDITRNKWERSYTENGKQRNETILETSADDSRGSKTGNLPLYYSVTADSSTTDLILEAGSCAQVNLGSTTQQKRDKSPQPLSGETINSANTWEPLRAFRVDPDRDIVNFQLSSLKVLSYGQSARVTVSMSCFPNSKVTFTGSGSWSTPKPLIPQSSAVETRNDVKNIPNRSGSGTTTTTSPGGFNIGMSTLTPTNTQQFQKGASTKATKEKANVPRDDIAIVLAETPNTADVTYATDWREDW